MYRAHRSCTHLIWSQEAIYSPYYITSSKRCRSELLNVDLFKAILRLFEVIIALRGGKTDGEMGEGVSIGGVGGVFICGRIRASAQGSQEG